MLTERDYEVLLLAGVCGYVTRVQIARELFTSFTRCYRRTIALFDDGLLEVTLLGSTAPDLLSLTAQGLEVVRERFPEVAQGLRVPGPLKRTGVLHRLAVVDARLYARAYGEACGTPLLEWSGAGGPLWEELGIGEHGLRPDGLLVLDDGNDGQRIAVEVDAGTEPSKVLDDKLRRYRSALAAGCVDELWVVVAGAGEGRLESLRRLVARLELAASTRVMPLCAVCHRPVDARAPGGARGGAAVRP